VGGGGLPPERLPEISPILDCGRGWAAPRRGNIFQFFHLILSTLVGKQIAENFVEIRSELPQISPILEWGVGGRPRMTPAAGVTYFNFYLPTHYPS